MCITPKLLTSIWSCIVVHGSSDYSVRSVYLEYIYPLYYMALLLTFINPLLLIGDSLGTSVILIGTHLNRIADSNINLSSSRKLTFMLPDSIRFKNYKYNTKSTRKISETSNKNILYTRRLVGWWYIGIKGDGGVKSKGTWLLIEKEK